MAAERAGSAMRLDPADRYAVAPRSYETRPREPLAHRPQRNRLAGTSLLRAGILAVGSDETVWAPSGNRTLNPLHAAQHSVLALKPGDTPAQRTLASRIPTGAWTGMTRPRWPRHVIAR
jgi:hypothetical protein